MSDIDNIINQLSNLDINKLDNKIKPHDLLIELIKVQKYKENKKNIWENSPYKDLIQLQSNNIGIVGETFIQNICELSNIQSNLDGNKTKKKGGGNGDGIIKNNIVEIKTAHLGCTGSSFQHELGEKPWIAKYMIFIDIAPQYIFLTIFNNFTEEHYKSNSKCTPVFPSKTITWRKQCGAFKLDTSLRINENNIKNNFTIKITPDTPHNIISDFIDKNII